MGKYDFVFRGFVIMWISFLALTFARPIILYFTEPSRQFWIYYYSFGFSYLAVSWFFMLNRHHQTERLEKFERYRQKKRMEEHAKQNTSQDHRLD